VVTRGYVPDSGDIIWLNFTPQAGREQAGRRPALVLTPRVYNEKTNLAIVCPITSRAKGYPFEVALPAAQRISGVVLADHLKSLDWRQRQAEKAARISRTILEQVLDRISALLRMP
jgi:mRNA interferase MazF